MSRNTMLLLVAAGAFILWQQSKKQQQSVLGVQIPTQFSNWDPFAGM